jgi:hypothetical protein
MDPTDSDSDLHSAQDKTRANSQFKHCGIQSDLPIEAAVSLNSEKCKVMLCPSTAVLLSHPCTQRGKFKYKAKTISQQTLFRERYAQSINALQRKKMAAVKNQGDDRALGCLD